tara:strand:- start:1096 stop:2091 length:996 start_codon:yes stop_codon:yes gene_type:complete
MNLKDRIGAFAKLGERINALKEDEVNKYASLARRENPWFTDSNVKLAFEGIASMIEAQKLNKWLLPYEINTQVPRIVGIVMAGNIPMVGFHDLLAVLVSGHYAAVKTSNKDSSLVKLIIEWLIEIVPDFKKNISIRDRLTNIDAVIATGSDNTARYFHYYFGKLPNIIRKNRVSVAIIDGTESREELAALGNDVFSYFGMGCRNVSKIFFPVGYDVKQILDAFATYESVGDNHKYRNNYDYHKSIYLINKTPHLDSGFLLWRETEELVSPLTVLYAESYTDKRSLTEKLKTLDTKIQCKVGHGFVPFGQAQCPEPWDYADSIDTIKFLSTI